jgi:hypothetical protein
MSSKETEAIRLFLADLYHRRQVNRKFNEIREELSPELLASLVADLRARGIIDAEEERYLQKRLHIS